MSERVRGVGADTELKTKTAHVNVGNKKGMFGIEKISKSRNLLVVINHASIFFGDTITET